MGVLLTLEDVLYLAPFRDLERDTVKLAKNLLRHLDNWEPKHLVSCWHAAATESDAMWRVYTGGRGEDAGVAVISALGNLVTAINELSGSEDYEFVDAHLVRYEEFVDTWEGDETPLLVKRPPFEHEREVRFLIEMTEAKQIGRLVSISLPTAIEKVIVSPFAAGWEVEAIQSVTKEYELDVLVEQSELYRTVG